MSEIAGRRLSNQHIAGKKPDKPEQVVDRLGAVQAQDYHQALWAIGSRLQNPTIASIEQSVAERQIVQTWLMRGTIHLVRAEDARWMLKLLAPRLLARDRRRLEQLELTPDTIERCKALLYDALHGNRRQTRSELMQLFEAAGIDPRNQRGYHLLWYTAQTGLICFGPREGTEQTFVLLDEWVPATREMPQEEALAHLCERFFGGHGPATIHDLAWWAGITLTEAKTGVEAAGHRLRSETIAGQTYWTAVSSPSAASVGNESDVYLLAGYDEYLLGYKDRSDVLKAEHARFMAPGNNGVFMPIIVVDGQIVGTWKRNVTSKGIDITLNLFGPLKRQKDDFLDAALRYCSFMAMPLIALELNEMIL